MILFLAAMCPWHAPPKTVSLLLGGKNCQATVTLHDIKYLTRLDQKMNCASDLEN